MKALLHYIVSKKLAKHVNRAKAVEIGAFLEAEGYTRDKLTFTKDHHQFVFSGRGNHWAVSYHKVEEVTP